MNGGRKAELVFDDSFFVPGTDENGKSSRLSFSVPPAVDRFLVELIARRTLPYRTKSDLLRHALVKHVETLKDIDPIIHSQYASVQAVLRVLQDVEAAAELENSIALLKEHMQYFIDKRMPDAARGLLEEIRKIVNGMPEGPFKNVYLQNLQEYERVLGPRLVEEPQSV